MGLRANATATAVRSWMRLLWRAAIASGEKGSRAASSAHSPPRPAVSTSSAVLAAPARLSPLPG
jgi:hypothetical protein